MAAQPVARSCHCLHLLSMMPLLVNPSRIFAKRVIGKSQGHVSVISGPYPDLSAIQCHYRRSSPSHPSARLFTLSLVAPSRIQDLSLIVSINLRLPSQTGTTTTTCLSVYEIGCDLSTACCRGMRAAVDKVSVSHQPTCTIGNISISATRCTNNLSTNGPNLQTSSQHHEWGS